MASSSVKINSNLQSFFSVWDGQGDCLLARRLKPALAVGESDLKIVNVTSLFASCPAMCVRTGYTSWIIFAPSFCNGHVWNARWCGVCCSGSCGFVTLTTFQGKELSQSNWAYSHTNCKSFRNVLKIYTRSFQRANAQSHKSAVILVVETTRGR